MIVLSLRGKIFTVAKDRLIKVVGTYFYGMLLSGVWQPNSDGVYIIDRPSEGFDRILDCLETGKLDCHGLTDYEIDCVYGNLDYFIIPFTRVWDYSIAHKIQTLNLVVHLQLSDQRLCGSAKENSICIYNMDTQIIEATMKGHRNGLTSIIQLEDGRICSSSNDHTMKLWSLESGECEITDDRHTYPVECLIQLTDGRVCGGSYGSIKIGNKDNLVNEMIIRTLEYGVYSLVQLRNGSLCSGFFGGHIKVWNIATGVCEMTLNGHTGRVTAIVVIDELRICSCSHDETIKVWITSSGLCDRTLEEPTMINTSRWKTHQHLDMILLQDGRLFTLIHDGSAKIWNNDTGTCELSIKVSDDKYSKLSKVIQLHDGRIVVSECNRLVYIMGE
jgi:WD40 repeat protein